MREFIKNINPLKKNEDEVKMGLYVIKKLLGFLTVYLSSMIIGEIIVILGLMLFGYNFFEGEMPSDNVMMLLKYYGFSIHLIITILYCKLIEKRNLASMGIVKKKIVKSYLLGIGLAIILLVITVILGIVSGAIVYSGISSKINIILIFTYFGGFVIQGAMEEFMCRGFLMNSLRYKVSTKMAILISSFMFVLPHFPTLLQADILVCIIGIANLFLFSAVVSLLMIKYNNIWVSCAVHSVWNFVIAIIIGINVSGSKSTLSVFNFNVNESMQLLNGGEYGVEAGLICTIVLIIFVIIIKRKTKGDYKYGIQQ